MKRADLAGGLLTALLVWMVVYPIAVVARDATLGGGGALGEFVSRPAEWRVLWASVWTSLASVALAGSIGIPLAFLFEWLDFPGRKTLGALVALPVVLPPLVGVIAFLFLYGESGFVARAVQAALRVPHAPWQLHGAGAILLVHAYSFYVYFYLLTRAGLAKLDASMLEAAEALGAGRLRALGRVVLPLVRPSLIGASLLTFMAALGSFSAPF
ncbi:MAG TPA: ABC transporter permease subunit, partial [Gemmatimonadales bacterium]|nr:ABC transporter permease subunit [Gemmatimonadales bacterium]